MLEEPIENATLPFEFVPKGSPQAKALAMLDTEINTARAEVLRRDKFGQTGQTAFVSHWNEGSTSWHSGHTKPYDWSGDWWEPEHRQKKQRTFAQGSMLAKWGVHKCDQGLVFGSKFLVTISKDVTIPTGACVGNYAYPRDPTRRGEWCSRNCADVNHQRPEGVEEAHLKVINLSATNNTAADAEIAKRVIETKIAWEHVAGKDDREHVMGGTGGDPSPDPTSTALVTAGKGAAGKGRGTGGGKAVAMPAGGKGKGKGGKGASGGKGGRGKGGKDGVPSFGRHRQ
jgi:hypothetical protein